MSVTNIAGIGRRQAIRAFTVRAVGAFTTILITAAGARGFLLLIHCDGPVGRAIRIMRRLTGKLLWWPCVKGRLLRRQE